MKSGVNNPEELEGVVLQDEDLMKKLMHTKSWKTQNVLKIQDDFMNGDTKENFPYKNDNLKEMSIEPTEKSPLVLGVALLRPTPSKKLMESGSVKPLTKY